MNSKRAKKMRKYVRQSLNERVGIGLKAFEQALRIKPKYLPMFLWKWGGRFYFTKTFYKMYFRVK